MSKRREELVSKDEPPPRKPSHSYGKRLSRKIQEETELVNVPVKCGPACQKGEHAQALREECMNNTLTAEILPMTAWVGIDVSQETLDVECVQEGKRRGRRRVKNTEQGCAELLDWLVNERRVIIVQTQVSMEATGWYSDLESHVSL
jgi:hypothetical protein